MSLKSKWVALVAGLVLAGSAQANLIVNGGFEDNAVANGGWNYFPSSSVNGWEGSNVEIWHNLFGIASSEGQQHAELNAHGSNSGNWSIFQNFATVVGQTYDVSFFYRARENNAEAFNFSVGTLNLLLTDHLVNSWTQFNNSFVATSALTQLRFTSTNTGTYGNLLDDIQVLARASVPEASTLMMFMMGMMGLVLARRKTRY